MDVKKWVIEIFGNRETADLSSHAVTQQKCHPDDNILPTEPEGRRHFNDFTSHYISLCRWPLLNRYLHISPELIDRFYICPLRSYLQQMSSAKSWTSQYRLHLIEFRHRPIFIRPAFPDSTRPRQRPTCKGTYRQIQ